MVYPSLDGHEISEDTVSGRAPASPDFDLDPIFFGDNSSAHTRTCLARAISFDFTLEQYENAISFDFPLGLCRHGVGTRYLNK
jgi:hypothetical protein